MRSFSIVQSVREIKPGGGVSGVAFELEKQFRSLNFETAHFTIENIKKTGALPAKQMSFLKRKLQLVIDVILYSILGTMKFRSEFNGKNQVISICHNDILAGDIYINHGLHHSMLLEGPSPLSKMLKNPLHIFLLVREWLRFNLDVHRRVVCFSDGDGEKLTKIYPKAKDKLVIIPNGVDVDKFSPDQQVGLQKRSELGLADTDFVMIFIGHEFTRKGLEFAINALPLLDANVHLIVVGGTAEYYFEKFTQQAAESGCNSRVHFLGTRADISSLLNAADVFVLPTFFEAWPLVGLEALAAGTPILMTAVGGIPQYLQDGENGFFISRQPEDIAAKARILIETPALLERMRCQGRQTALRYAWQSIAKQYIDLIQQVAEEKIQGA